MAKFNAEIDVIKKMTVVIEAADMQEARRKLHNLAFDPEDATEVTGWKISPTLKPVEESREFGEAESPFDFYKKQMKSGFA